MGGIGAKVVPKNIRNLQNQTRHDRRGLCGGDRPAQGGCWPAIGRTRIGPLRRDVRLVSQMLRP
jgi:hypothetical protein